MKNNFPPKTMGLLPNSAILDKKGHRSPQIRKIKNNKPYRKGGCDGQKKEYQRTGRIASRSLGCQDHLLILTGPSWR